MRWIGIGVAAGLAAWVGLSLALLRDPEPTLRVAAIQPDTPGRFAYSPGEDDPLVARYADLTEQAADDGARLVVWPEYGLYFDPCEEDAVGDVARDNDIFLVAAFGDIESPDLGNLRHRNEAVLITPEGDCVGRYAKQHPVRWIDERSDTDYGTPVFDTDLGRLAMVICYDMDFTDVTRALAAKGAQLVAAPSEDWSEMAEYHAAPLVFRAVENRVAAVKSDQAYDSSVIDPYGRIVAEEIDPDGATAVVVADVPLGPGTRTIWNRSAGWQEIGWLVLALLVATVVVRDLASGLRSPPRGS